MYTVTVEDAHIEHRQSYEQSLRAVLLGLYDANESRYFYFELWIMQS